MNLNENDSLAIPSSRFTVNKNDTKKLHLYFLCCNMPSYEISLILTD